jgi:hypothetical protein
MDPIVRNALNLMDAAFRPLNRPHVSIPQADGCADASDLRCIECGNFRHSLPKHKPTCSKAYRNCPGCAGAAEFHIASCPKSAQSGLGISRSQTLKIPVKPFDVDAALAGAPFIHRLDACGDDARSRVSRTIVKLDHPEHPVIFVYCSEWIPYEQTDEGLEQMAHDLWLVDDQQGRR